LIEHEQKMKQDREGEMKKIIKKLEEEREKLQKVLADYEKRKKKSDENLQNLRINNKKIEELLKKKEKTNTNTIKDLTSGEIQQILRDLRELYIENQISYNEVSSVAQPFLVELNRRANNAMKQFNILCPRISAVEFFRKIL